MGDPHAVASKQADLVASVDQTHQAPDPAHDTGSGYARVVALTRNGNADPAQVATVIEQYPGDKAQIVQFLQQHLGNGFTQQVFHAMEHAPAGGANLNEHGAFEHFGDGNAGIDSAGQGRCRNERGPGCFLEGTQRGELNSQIRGNLTLVAINYNDAVEQCRVTELVKKIDELKWYQSLLLGGCITVIETLVPMAGAAFASAGTIAKAAPQLAATVISDAEKEMKTLTKAQLSSAIKASVTLGKTNAIKSFTAAGSDQTEQANAKEQAKRYTGIMKQNAMIMWTQLNKDIGTMDDSQAMVLLNRLNPTVLTSDAFLVQCTAELARFAESNVSKIGRESTYEDGKHVEREVRIARVISDMEPMRYVYMDRVFDGWYRDVTKRNAEKTERSGVYDDQRNAFSLNQEADWKIDGEHKRGRETQLRPDKILNTVEPEFLELAQEKQKDTWLNNIETYQIRWINGQEQVVKVAGA